MYSTCVSNLNCYFLLSSDFRCEPKTTICPPAIFPDPNDHRLLPKLADYQGGRVFYTLRQEHRQNSEVVGHLELSQGVSQSPPFRYERIGFRKRNLCTFLMLLHKDVDIIHYHTLAENEFSSYMHLNVNQNITD